MRTLTTRHLDSLKRSPRRRLVRDPETRGLFFVVMPTGGKSWILRCQVHGDEHWVALGDYPAVSLKDARLNAQAKLTDLKKPGNASTTSRPEDVVTVGEIAKVYVETYLPTLAKATQEEYSRRITTEILPAYGHATIGSLTVKNIILLRNERFKGHPVSGDRFVFHLKTILEFGRQSGYYASNPAEHVGSMSTKAQKRKGKRTRFLDGDEIGRFWIALGSAPSPIAAYYRFAMLTGQRVGGQQTDQGEIAPMRWSEIMDGNWTIPRQRVKNRVRDHKVPLTETALHLLAGLPRQTDYVFTNPIRDGRTAHVLNPKKYFIWAKDHADLTAHLRPHDLRRTVVSQLKELGYLNEQIAYLVNHINDDQTDWYDGSKHDALKREMATAWEQKLLAAVKAVEAQQWTCPAYPLEVVASAEERFWRHVIKRGHGECWTWKGSTNSKGYGRFTVNGQQVMVAHRFSWQIQGGAIPNGKWLIQTCGNKACVNPEHLVVAKHGGRQSPGVVDSVSAQD